MKKAKQNRPSKLDELTTATFQDHTHLSTYEIAQRRAALEAQACAHEMEIVRLTANVAEVRAALKRTNAMILGLGLAVERR